MRLKISFYTKFWALDVHIRGQQGLSPWVLSRATRVSIHGPVPCVHWLKLLTNTVHPGIPSNVLHQFFVQNTSIIQVKFMSVSVLINGYSWMRIVPTNSRDNYLPNPVNLVFDTFNIFRLLGDISHTLFSYFLRDMIIFTVLCVYDAIVTPGTLPMVLQPNQIYLYSNKTLFPWPIVLSLFLFRSRIFSCDSLWIHFTGITWRHSSFLVLTISMCSNVLLLF